MAATSFAFETIEATRQPQSTCTPGERDMILIAAAAAAVLGPNVVIHGVRPWTEPASAWAREGRLCLQDSHCLPRQRVMVRGLVDWGVQKS